MLIGLSCPKSCQRTVAFLCAFIFPLTCLIALMSISACHVGSQSTGFPYPVIDTGITISESVTKFYWIDNEHLVFGGFDQKPPPQDLDQARSAARSIFIWNANTNTYVRHGPWGRTDPILCFDKGYIVYNVDQIVQPQSVGRNDVLAGPIGAEKPAGPGPEAFVPVTQACDPYPHQKHPLPGYIICDLSPQDGSIFVARSPGAEEGKGEKEGAPLNRSNQNDSVQLLRPGVSEGIQLPILAKEMEFCPVAYSEYARKYIITARTWRSHDMRSDPTWPPPPGTQMRLYLLSTNGDVETYDLPPGTYPASYVQPTRVGIFWASYNSTRYGLEVGSWLMRDRKIIRVYPSVMGAAKVSPDGCRLAFFVGDKNSSLITAKVMSFCGDNRGG